jgi:hypothetical protein
MGPSPVFKTVEARRAQFGGVKLTEEGYIGR